MERSKVEELIQKVLAEVEIVLTREQRLKETLVQRELDILDQKKIIENLQSELQHTKDELLSVKTTFVNRHRPGYGYQGGE